jgi:RNA polymerase-binding transcription factor DksA
MTPMNDADKADPNMLGDRDEEFAEAANELGEFELRYKEIKSALDKIDNTPEKYGMCEISGQPIEHDRLEANPAAKTCKAMMNQ